MVGERTEIKEPRQDRIHIAIAGASGRIGSALSRNLSNRFELTDLQHVRQIQPEEGVHLEEGFDITDCGSVQRHVENLARNGVQVIINCAGVVNVDQSEKERGSKEGPTFQVNVVGAINLAKACNAHRLRLIQVSSEYVFAGNKSIGEKYTENNTPSYFINAPTWYGVTKAWSESEAKMYNPKTIVVRVSQVQGQNFGLFTATLRAIEKGVPFTRASNQLVSPICEQTASAAIAKIAQKLEPEHNIYHVSSTDADFSYNLCLRLAVATGQLNKARDLISLRTLEELVCAGEQSVVRPKNAVLDVSRFEEEFGQGILGNIDREIEKYLASLSS